MLLEWDAWIYFSLTALGATGMMAQGVFRYSLSIGRKSTAILESTFSVLICLTFMTGSLYAAYLMDHSLLAMKNKASPIHLQEDWGKQMSKEDRSKYSQLIARHDFVDWGIHTNHFDSNGNFVLYKPDDEDRRARATQLAYIQRTDFSRTLFLWSAAVWALIPWLALALGLTLSIKKLTAKESN